MTRGGDRTFAARVVRWQEAHGRHDLPWQRTRDPYRIWLSEIMLQQTQVATVVPYYERFVAAFPDVRSLAGAAQDDVLALWSGLGYYGRAHRLHACARTVVNKHRGTFPCDSRVLATLPGIGRSTAAAIAVFAAGERAAILEGNVKRVLARHRAVEGWPGSPRVQDALWTHAESLLPERSIERYTQGMMDLGAIVCTRTGPACERCPVAEDCGARISGRVSELPAPRPRRVARKRQVRLLVIERAGGEILFEKRPPTGVWSGLCSLPEVAMDDDLANELRARFGIAAAMLEPLPAVTHAFTHFTLEMHPARVHVDSGPVGVEAPGRFWLTREAAMAAALPAPIRRMLHDLPGISEERPPPRP